MHWLVQQLYKVFFYRKSRAARPIPLLAGAFLVVTFSLSNCWAQKQATKKNAHKVQTKQQTHNAAKPQSVFGVKPQTGQLFRGWGYLVRKLREDGISKKQLGAVYQDHRMPLFTDIPFSLAPKEPHSIYAHFQKPLTLQIAKRFLKRHKSFFDQAEDTFRVSRSIIAAIFLIETQAGLVTGKDLIINRLSRLASIAEPSNLTFNFARLRKDDSSVTFEQVRSRALYLEDTFYPEVSALLEISRKQKLDIFQMRGSSAGAFGIPQFLPSNVLKFGVDANKDGLVSLFHEADAIWSTANFLSSFGWQDNGPVELKRRVVWKYNHSEAYVDTVLEVANQLATSN